MHVMPDLRVAGAAGTPAAAGHSGPPGMDVMPDLMVPEAPNDPATAGQSDPSYMDAAPDLPLSKALDALAAAGGPNEIGSVRNIQLIRGGEKKAIDVYAFMKDPSLQSQYYLEDGDIIHIPVADRLVYIEGAVRRPMGYELKANEQLQDNFI